ncbi:MAG TPA: GntR family transcriptional regulator [Streptosporangiaceae bacterium]|jgi:GntR family transcriptional regulator
MPDPRYRQIADDLRGKIETGQLPPGAQLPTEAELMEQYAVSRNTIRDAMRLLVTVRLIDTRPGRGTFVIERFKPFVTTISEDSETGFGGGEGEAFVREVSQLSRKARTTDPQVEVQRVTGRVAHELRLDEGAQVVSRHQRRFIDESPYSMQTSFYPMDFVTQGATNLILAVNIKEGAVAYLESELGIEQAGYQDRVQVRVPMGDELSFFKLPETGVSIIETYRTAYDLNGNPFRVTVSVYPADRNHLINNVGKVPDEVKSPQWLTEEI